MHPAELQEQSGLDSSPKKEQTIDTIEHIKPEEHGIQSTQDLSEYNTTEQDPHLGKGSPGKQQWKLFQANAQPFRAIVLDLWIPWKLFAFPIVEFASFVVSWSASCFLTLNLVQSQAFAAPPW